MISMRRWSATLKLLLACPRDGTRVASKNAEAGFIVDSESHRSRKAASAIYMAIEEDVFGCVAAKPPSFVRRLPNLRGRRKP
jgi:hypothetical protein